MREFTSHMDAALIEARAAAGRGEVPVGAILLDGQSQIVARTGNRTREMNDPTAHAEVLAIRAACMAAKSERLPGYRLYVTLEPCPMCAAAISLARIEVLYYGASDAKSGGVEQGARVFEQAQCHHKPQVYSGINEAECSQVLTEFFAKRR